MLGHPLTRRELLQKTPFGFGFLALAGLCAESAAQQPADRHDPLAPRPPHFRARARRVIFLCMSGGPSHVDTFDYKPKLVADAGRVLPESNRNGVRQRGGELFPAVFRFARHGQSGQWISDVLPQLSRHADELCVIKSMVTDIPEHAQAILQLHTGESRFIRPSMGSWLLYGLGSENRDLPGFVVISPPTSLALLGGAQSYSNAFLPAAYQGTLIDPRAGLTPPTANTLHQQRERLDLIQTLNRELLARQQIDTEVEGVINSFELGFRMQTVLPEIMSVAGESRQTLESYGNSDFGRQCLIARRLSEAGVRFVEAINPGWDHHNNVADGLRSRCREIDQPIAALLTDLKQRGLLDDTLVVWGGEFGRAPVSESRTGRPHNALGYTMWLAGGGVKPGFSFGTTDEYGLAAAENPVHVHDLHATILHLLGLDHQRLTFRYGGRDQSLTDIHGRVVREILA